MVLHLILLFFLLTLLFILSKKVANYTYFLFFLLSQSKNISIAVLSLLLLPGTIVHELSHFLLASILRVPTGELSVIPTIDEKTGEVKAGRLMLGATDPFRHTLIGLAPTLIGLVLIYLIGRIFFLNLSNILNTKYLILNTVGAYLFFVISTTMFSSKKDMESLKIALPIALLIILSLYFIGLRISLTANLIVRIESILKELNGYLLIVTAVNFVIFLFLAANLKLWQKILRREIHPRKFL